MRGSRHRPSPREELTLELRRRGHPGPVLGVRERDKPAQDGRLAGARSGGDHSRLAIYCRRGQPHHQLGQDRSPPGEIPARLGFNLNPPAPRSPVFDVGQAALGLEVKPRRHSPVAKIAEEQCSELYIERIEACPLFRLRILNFWLIFSMMNSYALKYFC